MTCPPTEHHFEKFDETTIFCTACGESKVIEVADLIERLRQIPAVAPCPWPHVQPYVPQYPPYEWWRVTSDGTGDWRPLPPGSTITYATGVRDDRRGAFTAYASPDDNCTLTS